MNVVQIEVRSSNGFMRWKPWVPEWSVPSIGDRVILQRTDQVLSHTIWEVIAKCATSWHSGGKNDFYYVRETLTT